jgi:nicotinamidase/pyrazinamidase
MLCIIDMQNDFIDQENGLMAVKGAEGLIEGILRKIEEYEKRDDLILYTLNVHDHVQQNQRSEKEKKWGQDIVAPLKHKLSDKVCIPKTYHAIAPEDMVKIHRKFSLFCNTIELVGVETHICILSTAVVFRNEFPEATIAVDKNLCLSSDMDMHAKALSVMEQLKIEVRG